MRNLQAESANGQQGPESSDQRERNYADKQSKKPQQGPERLFGIKDTGDIPSYRRIKKNFNPFEEAPEPARTEPPKQNPPYYSGNTPGYQLYGQPVRLAADMSGGGDNKTHGMRQDNRTEAQKLKDGERTRIEMEYQADIAECIKYALTPGEENKARALKCTFEAEEKRQKSISNLINK